MSKSIRALANREQGQFAISKGTSLAIESLANLVPDRPKVRPEPITQVDAVLINVRTLYRNMLSAIKAVAKQDVNTADIPDFIAQEMRQCSDAVEKISKGKVHAFFYLCKYPDLKQEFPKALLIQPNTLKQRQAKEQEDEVIRVMSLNPEKYGKLKVFDYYVEGGGLANERVALLTHLPLDLVDRYQFKEMYLLESNTGAFKSYRDFGSKFKVKPDGVYFPFNAFTLQVLGDGGKMFMPQDSAVTKFISEVSKRSQWTHMTTMEKIKYNLDNSGDAKLGAFLKAIMRS